MAQGFLAGGTATFNWTDNGNVVTDWWLYSGSTVGGKQFYDSGKLNAVALSQQVDLPMDGSTVYIRLWYRINGEWGFRDAAYTAVDNRPLITTPAPASTLAGSTVTFNWAANGNIVTEWWLYAGSTVGGKQFFDSGSLEAGTLSQQVTTLPNNGSTVHVRLWYRIGGAWASQDFSYTAAN